MRIHWFQHVPFEGLGKMGELLAEWGHTLSVTRFYAGELPGAECVAADALIVMGGPMNIYESERYPWLAAEKVAIKEAITAGKRVLGICLGAQLLADALGGRVMRNTEPEIGWWPIQRCRDLPTEASALVPADGATVLHWHGDTYTLPPGAICLAQSAACAQQAFLWEGRVLAWQFHLEMGVTELDAICTVCGDELVPGRPYVQNLAELREGAAVHAAANQEALGRALSRWLVDGGS